ncbi:MAG: type II secretion system GspH family protein [Phycisphaerae bacterium]|nr:type II secretion system GspH family protein [Phycisphaerae bacterium]
MADRALAFDRFRAGFSLTEMLVVLFIIILLMAILSPAVQTGKDYARKVTCASNLHQIYMASMAYAQANRLIGVPTKENRVIANLKYSDFVMPFMYPNFKLIDEDNDGKIDADAYSFTDIFRCPSNQDSKKLANKKDVQLDYGLNHFGRTDTMDTANPGVFLRTMGGQSFGAVRNPTAVYLADADTDSPEDIGGVSRSSEKWPLEFSFNTSAYARHRQGHNTVSLDGSQEWTYGYYDEPTLTDDDNKKIKFKPWLIRKR